MGKILFITGILYLLYYAGNVVYDLFIKKPPIVLNEAEGEIISLGTITTEAPTAVKTIREEEVEDLNTPDSYQIDDEENLFSNHNQDSIRKDRFEEEMELERFSNNAPATEEKEAETHAEASEIEAKEAQKSFLSRVTTSIGINEKNIISKTKEIIPIKITDEMFSNFLGKATDHVVVGNQNGNNFYKSSLIF